MRSFKQRFAPVFGGILTALTVIAVTPEVAAAAPTPPAGLPDDYGGFVYVEDGKLKLNGGDFYFSGANSYAMLYSPDEAEATLQVAKSLGLNAIRFWGFWDGEERINDDNGEPTIPARGTDRWGRPVLQSQPRAYNEVAFRNFDQAIYLAHLYGVKLVIPLLNEWDEFGGLKQYLAWDGFQWPETNKNCGPYQNGICYSEIENIVKADRYRFFTDCTICKDLYLDWVYAVLNRVNTITGVKYKDDPAILSWEVMNEPRIGPWEYDVSTEIIRDFLRDGARFIKANDPNHLVSTGEEGFFFEGEAEDYMARASGSADASGAGGEGGAGGASSAPATVKTGYGWDTAKGEGSSFVLDTQIPEVDLGTFHAWPFNWNKAHEQWGPAYAGRIDEFMVQWVESHAAVAKVLGKPVFLGEFGWQILRAEGSDIAGRDKILKATYDAALRTDTAGVMYWNITGVHNVDEATYKGPYIDRPYLDGASWDDEPLPHDMDFRFDIFCPEDVSTCSIIKEATQKLVGKVQNPDPPFTTICFNPRTTCGDECVILDSSPTHCGACDSACSTGEDCKAGVCTARPTAAWVKPSSPYDTSGGCSVTEAPSSGGAPLAWAGLACAAGGLLLSRRRRSVS